MSTKYEYSSYSSSSKGGGDAADTLFAQADTNRDGVIDRSEFENLVGGGGRSSYEVTGYSSGLGLEGTGRSGRYTSSSYESSSGYDASAIREAASYTAESNAAWSRYGAEVRGAGLYYDPNPQIIRRETSGAVQTYTQNIKLRFLRPPPVAASGTLTIKEVRAPQPPPLPPLRIKQQEVSAVQLPPLILRERPPLPPAPLPSETIIRKIEALPMPPRSVIIERYAAAAAAPRDIIIERWLPYETVGERKTIVQRAEVVESYPAPRNVIILYGASQVRVVRQFQNLGVFQEDPQAYIARYGAHLYDSHTLLQQARAAGVVEDISTPAVTTTSGYKSLAYSSDASYGVGGETSIIGVSSRDLGGGSSYSSSTYETSTGGVGGLIGSGLESGYVEGVSLTEGGGSGYGSSVYKSSSTYSSSGGVGSTGFSSTEAKL